jgi:NDP-sugar pyrophosphorylase family protein
MQAILLAGGKGTRLRPYTAVLPKPLMPIGDRPILDVVMQQLVRSGVTRISISVGYLSGLLESWVRHHRSVDVPVDFVYEEEPLGTAGALRNVEGLDGTFLALNGDVLTTLDFTDLVTHHRASGAVATMATNDRAVHVQYGVVHTDERGHIERLEEKPTLRYTVSMGVYAMEPAIVDLIAHGERIDFPDLLLRAMDAGRPVATFPFADYWRDIGNREDYESAIEDFEADPGRFIG